MQHVQKHSDNSARGPRAFLRSLAAIAVTLLVLAILAGLFVVLEPRTKNADTTADGSGAYSIPTK